MPDKDKEIPAKYLDRRVVDRYIKKGMVDEKELGRHLKALPDLTDQAVKVETGFSEDGDIGPAL